MQTILLYIFTLLVVFLPKDVTGAETVFLSNTVISQDTIWSGNILIEGVVLVGRSAALTIKPGTIIKFKRIDSNNDGIGDSEIRVLGQLIAKGTAKQPIFFMSAEKKPAAMDWSYLLIFTSGMKNVIKHCRFSDAFSGLQVHFSTASVSDCIFTENHEGIRFGRAKINIHNNNITKNNIGIRFTRMEGPAEIKYNSITGNRTGIFLVPSGQNIVDFFEPDRSGKAWNDGLLEIYSNNIFNNTDYNLKLGAKQMWDLKISGNWWNSSDVAIIRQSIYDKGKDQELGRAMIEPISQQMVNAAGLRDQE